jgi:plastocyanin
MLNWRLCCLALAGVLLVGAAGSVAYAQSAISVGMAEFMFTPSTLNVSSGNVTFTLRNEGQFPHTVHIDGVGDVADPVPGGQTVTASVNLAPGTYTFWCPVDGHRDRGMEGTLIVAGGAQAGRGGAQAGRAGGLDPLQLAGVLAVAGVGALVAGLRRKRTAA